MGIGLGVGEHLVRGLHRHEALGRLVRVRLRLRLRLRVSVRVRVRARVRRGELEEAVVAARLVEHARDALHEDDARQHAAQGEAHAGEPQAGLGPLPASLGFEASAAYRQENMKT